MKKVIIIINKQDLPRKIEEDYFKNFNIINTSIKNNEGINEILDKIKELFNLNILENNDYTYLSNSRQIAIIKECVRVANEIYKANLLGTEVDLIQIDLNHLWELLGEIIGSTYKEELLDEIFSKFCLGK